jgi:hypothetical protein
MTIQAESKDSNSIKSLDQDTVWVSGYKTTHFHRTMGSGARERMSKKAYQILAIITQFG